MKMKGTWWLYASVIFAFAAIVAISEVPQVINYQGRLTDPQGNPVPDGDYQITFNIWNLASGGTLLWTSEARTIHVASGLFTYALGSVEPFPSGLFADSARWLGIKVNNDEEITPRTKLTPAPYAYHALQSDTSDYAAAVASQGVDNEMIMDTIISFDKLARNEGQPGDVITFLDNRAAYWGRSSLQSIVYEHCPPGWTDDGSVVRLHNSYDKVGLGTAVPEARLHVYSNQMATETDPLHVSINDGSGGYDTRLVMATSGNVGIGTANPGTYQLSVRSSGEGLGYATASIVNQHPTTGVAMRCENTSTMETMLVWNHGDGDMISCIGGGTTERTFRVKNDGEVECTVLHLTGGGDIVEPFEMADGMEHPAGAVVIIDPENPGKLRLSTSAYDTRVAGIISGAGGINPGIRLSQDNAFTAGQNVAISGRVYCQVDATYGAIKPGDLLTTSPNPGYAMKASDRSRSYGAIIGKAMTPLESGQDLVLVLVNLQ